jgi:hypothetical protein
MSPTYFPRFLGMYFPLYAILVVLTALNTGCACRTQSIYMADSFDTPASIIGANRDRTSASASGGALRFPASEKALYGMAFRFMATKYDPGASKSIFDSITTFGGGHIFLPLPVSGIVENQSLSYDNVEMGPSGAAINAGGSMGAAARAGLTGQKVDSGAVGAASVRGADALAYGVRQAVQGLSPQAGVYIDQQLGSILNPFSIAAFRGVTPRAHAFTFRLVPKNEADSALIREITDQFKYHSLPARSQNSLAFLTIPDEVEIEFFGTQNLFKFARCVIVSVNVSYTPFGPPAFFGSDGAPAAVELQLQFQEVEQLTRQAYKGNKNINQFDVGKAGGDVDGNGPTLTAQDLVPPAPPETPAPPGG